MSAEKRKHAEGGYDVLPISKKRTRDGSYCCFIFLFLLSGRVVVAEEGKESGEMNDALRGVRSRATCCSDV